MDIDKKHRDDVAEEIAAGKARFLIDYEAAKALAAYRDDLTKALRDSLRRSAQVKAKIFRLQQALAITERRRIALASHREAAERKLFELRRRRYTFPTADLLRMANDLEAAGQTTPEGEQFDL